MKLKNRVALVAALVTIATITVVAAELRDGKSEEAIYRLKSHDQVVAEIRVVAPANIQFSQFTMRVGGGRTIWRASDPSKTITARLLVEGGQPVEFTAEEIELNREIDTDPKKSLEKK